MRWELDKWGISERSVPVRAAGGLRAAGRAGRTAPRRPDASPARRRLDSHSRIIISIVCQPAQDGAKCLHTLLLYKTLRWWFTLFVYVHVNISHNNEGKTTSEYLLQGDIVQVFIDKYNR